MLSSLRTRLVAFCVLIVIVAMATVAVTNYLGTRQQILQLISSQTRLLLDRQSAVIEEWVKRRQAAISSLKPAAALADANSAIKAAELAGGLDDVYIGLADKRMVILQGRKSPVGYDPTSRIWYKQAQAANGAIITKPYEDFTSKKLVITFAEAVEKMGVVAGDVMLEGVINGVLNIKPTPSSHAFLLDIDGTVIAHPNKDFSLQPVEKVQTSLSASSVAALAKEQGFRDLEMDGKRVLLFAHEVGRTGWLLVVAMDYAEATAALHAIVVRSLLSTLCISALATYFLYALVTKLLYRIHHLRHAITAAGDGDFTQRMRTRGSDELAQIIETFNHFSERITGVLNRIRVASDTVRVSAAEIASGNLDLSNRTEQQCHALANTAQSVDKLSQNVRLNAQSAVSANKLAASASDVAVRGGTVVAGVVEMMSSMNQSSKRIFDIISVIDNIAFQTNILALNAAVEAARAGEQGKGFAVVATEVRSLAGRSATAAREIQALINDSVKRVESGTVLVEQAGGTMNEIVASVKRVTDIIANIAQASSEQSSELDRISQSMGQMDSTTQQNTALVEEAASAAHTLQDEANALAEVVSVFKLRSDPLQIA